MIAAWINEWSSVMKNTSKLLAVALVAGLPAFAVPAAAAPIGQPLSQRDAVTQNDSSPALQQVQFRRWGGGWNRGWRSSRGWWGPGFAAGVIGGAILGSQPWNNGYYDPGYAYAPGYAYEPGYTYAQPGYAAPERDDAYCQQRFRSYDRASGTYLGYDGVRHPCP
jgi:hypothetical protein